MNDEKMSVKFQVEQQILDCWHVVDDMKVLFENMTEREDMNQSQVSNILLGMYELYQIKFEKLFLTFEKLATENRNKVPFETAQESSQKSEGFYYKGGIDTF